METQADLFGHVTKPRCCPTCGFELIPKEYPSRPEAPSEFQHRRYCSPRCFSRRHMQQKRIEDMAIVDLCLVLYKTHPTESELEIFITKNKVERQLAAVLRNTLAQVKTQPIIPCPSSSA